MEDRTVTTSHPDGHDVDRLREPLPEPADDATHGPGDGTVDPLDEAPPTTPRGSLVLTVAAFVLGAIAFLPTGLSFLVGPVGMACGLIAHLKGRRAGFGAAVLAAVGTVVGLSLRTLLDIY